jgi:hypothetical protein
MAQKVLNESAAENLVLRVYKSNTTPTSTMTIADLTEATFSGYLATTLTSTNWTVGMAGGVELESTGDSLLLEDGSGYLSTFTYAEYNSAVTFACTADTSESIYGLYLTGVTSSALYWAGRLSDAPHLLSYQGEAVSFRPKLTITQ